MVSRPVLLCAFIIVMVFVAGCIFSSAGDSGKPSGVSPSQSSSGLPLQSGSSPTPAPGAFDPVANGAGYPTRMPATAIIGGANRTSDNGGTQIISTPTPVPSPTPVPVISATTGDWGSDGDKYSRGSTANGWVYVTNTGNVPISQIDFTITIKKTILFVPVEKTFTFSATGLNILPGARQKVLFSQPIPSDYQGISTAGDYKLTAKASLNGDEIGSYSKNIKIV